MTDAQMKRLLDSMITIAKQQGKAFSKLRLEIALLHVELSASVEAFGEFTEGLSVGMVAVQEVVTPEVQAARDRLRDFGYTVFKGKIVSIPQGDRGPES